MENNEITQEEYNKIMEDRIEKDKQLDIIRKRYQKELDEIKYINNEYIWQCNLCKKYFKEIEKRYKSFDRENSICINCKEEKITSITILRPSDKEIEDFQEYRLENSCSDWQKFKIEVYTNKGKDSLFYDILRIKDKNGNDVIRIDTASGEFFIHSDFVIIPGEQKGEFILQKTNYEFDYDKQDFEV